MRVPQLHSMKTIHGDNESTINGPKTSELLGNSTKEREDRAGEEIESLRRASYSYITGAPEEDGPPAMQQGETPSKSETYRIVYRPIYRSMTGNPTASSWIHRVP